MSSISVDVVTLSYVGSGSNKFYRVYYSTPGTPKSFGLKQWGSQRNGRSGGQFSICDRYDAMDAVTDKKSEGYFEVDRSTITLDENTIKTLSQDKKALGRYAESVATLRSGVVPSPPKNTPKPNTPKPPQPQAPAAPSPLDSESLHLDDTLAKCMATLEVAATDPIKAMSHAAVIRDEVSKAHEQLARIESYLTTIDLMTHEEMN